MVDWWWGGERIAGEGVRGVILVEPTMAQAQSQIMAKGTRCDSSATCTASSMCFASSVNATSCVQRPHVLVLGGGRGGQAIQIDRHRWPERAVEMQRSSDTLRADRGVRK